MIFYRYIKNFMKKIKRKQHLAKKYIFPKLIKRIKINFVLIFLIFLLALYKLFSGDITAFYFLLALLIWIPLWFLFGRMYKIHWHIEEKKVMSKIDKIWIVFLLFYIWIEVGKKWIFSPIVPVEQISWFWIALLSWLFIWRIIYMLYKVKQVVKEKK